MRIKKLALLFIFIPVLAFSQSDEPQINSTAMEGVDFTKFQTFGWLPFLDSIQTETSEFDKQKLDEYVTAAVSSELQSRGLTVNETSPDLYVRYAILVERKTGTVTEPVYGKPNVGVGVGFGRGGFSYGGVSVSSPSVVGSKTKQVQYKHSALVIEAIDVSGNQVVWRGSADRTKEEDGSLVNVKLVIEEVVPKIFKKFPVKKAKKK